MDGWNSWKQLGNEHTLAVLEQETLRAEMYDELARVTAADRSAPVYDFFVKASPCDSIGFGPFFHLFHDYLALQPHARCSEGRSLSIARLCLATVVCRSGSLFMHCIPSLFAVRCIYL